MMGAPIKDMIPAEDASVEALLTTLRTIDPAERRKHASVFNYWLSIRGKRQFPAIRDLDPLEISDAGPFSLLMEMIGGGEDAEIRHLGHAIKMGAEAHRLSDVEAPSLLACIHAKLPVVASSRQAFAFEDRFDTPEGKQRCWVTLLPLSANGTWIDFVYGFVSLEGVKDEDVEAVEAVEEFAETIEGAASSADEAADAFRVELRPIDEDESIEAMADPDQMAEPEPEHEPTAEIPPGPEPLATLEPEPVVAFDADPEPEPEPEYPAEPEAPAESGFSSKLLAGLASVGGFYGKVIQSQPAAPASEPEPEPENEFVEEFEPESIVEPMPEPEPKPAAEEMFAPESQPQPSSAPAQAFEPDPEPEIEPDPEPVAHVEQPQPEPQQASASRNAMEADLQNKLSGVRAMAEEARAAQERSNIALYEGLGAAYDFALDAEDQPEDYLRLVEAQGLKIQLRSPMKPVVKLAFAGLTDDHTIGQLEAVLSWALKADLPRGTLAERIVAEGGIGRLLDSKPN